MTISKIRKRVMAGIKRRTLEFNEQTFPEESEEWTPEQKAIFAFLNGESGGFKKVHESDQPEILKNLTKLAGIEGMKSRFNIREVVTPPAYTVIVLRESNGGYPASFPLVAGRISGLWTEEGTGSSSAMSVLIKNLRPATLDEVARIEKEFPEDKLVKLYGAIDFTEETDLREVIATSIIERTKEFAGTLSEQWPEGITEKGKQILKLGMSLEYRQAFSVILDDPHLLETYYAPPQKATFLPYCAVVHHDDDTGSCYKLNQVHVQADISPSDTFFTYPEEYESNSVIGNHNDTRTKNFRVATDDEIREYVKELPTDRLHLYVSSIPKDRLNSML
jgi:hypothetical protein